MKHNSLNHDLPDEKDFKMKVENNQANQENPTITVQTIKHQINERVERI